MKIKFITKLNQPVKKDVTSINKVMRFQLYASNIHLRTVKSRHTVLNMAMINCKNCIIIALVITKHFYY